MRDKILFIAVGLIIGLSTLAFGQPVSSAGTSVSMGPGGLGGSPLVCDPTLGCQFDSDADGDVDNIFLPTSVQISSTSDGYIYIAGSSGSLNLDLTSTGRLHLIDQNDTELLRFVVGANTQAGIFTNDGKSGNTLLLGNNGCATQNFDHGLQTNPTWYVHSDTCPNDNNTQWISMTHDQTDGVIDVGLGNITFSDTAVFNGSGNVGIGTTVTNFLISLPTGAGINESSGAVRISGGTSGYFEVDASGEVNIDSGSTANITSVGGVLNLGASTNSDIRVSLAGTGNFIVTADADSNVGIGSTNPIAILDVDIGTGWGQINLNGSSGGCVMYRDTDDAGWTECSALDGTVSCTLDADGVCDGS